jgi:hypothetical protein
MSRLILCMSMSLDGFVSGVDDKLTHRVDEGDEPPDGTTFHTDVAACSGPGGGGRRDRDDARRECGAGVPCRR